jgi:hypothetical protein
MIALREKPAHYDPKDLDIPANPFDISNAIKLITAPVGGSIYGLSDFKNRYMIYSFYPNKGRCKLGVYDTQSD